MDYQQAAARSGVEIRELREMREFAEVFRLFDVIWRPEPGNPPVTVELMKVISHAGGYLAGAYEDGALVGASVALLAAGGGLHSHVTGASIGRGIGYALKLHQREWCRERGIGWITWTFDPLVRRNAHFNLVKLGAMPGEYLEDFYGPMADAINEGDASDRVLAVWRLEEEQVPAREPYRGVVGLREVEGRPVAGTVEGDVVLVGTPKDIETLRHTDPEAAKAWRFAVREVLGGLMAAGGKVVGFTPEGEYVINRGFYGDS